MTTKQKTRAAVFAFTVAFLAPEAVSAQTRGTVNPQPLPALAKPDDPATPAKELFGRQSMPAPVEARVIGFYSKGCLAGAKALPINGKTWQVMRLSRNRNWGHPPLTWGRSGQGGRIRVTSADLQYLFGIQRSEPDCMTRLVSEHDQPHIRSPRETAAPISRLRRSGLRKTRPFLKTGFLGHVRMRFVHLDPPGLIKSWKI